MNAGTIMHPIMHLEPGDLCRIDRADWWDLNGSFCIFVKYAAENTNHTLLTILLDGKLTNVAREWITVDSNERDA